MNTRVPGILSLWYIYKLDDSGYEVWCRSFLKHLLEEDESYDKTGKNASWGKENRTVIAWIMNSFHRSLYTL